MRHAAACRTGRHKRPPRGSSISPLEEWLTTSVRRLQCAAGKRELWPYWQYRRSRTLITAAATRCAQALGALAPFAVHESEGWQFAPFKSPDKAADNFLEANNNQWTRRAPARGPSLPRGPTYLATAGRPPRPLRRGPPRGGARVQSPPSAPPLCPRDRAAAAAAARRRARRALASLALLAP
jgi:hypothetical protein